MNENKRLFILFGVIVAIVALILLISFWPEADKSFSCGVKADGDYNKLGKVDYKQYQCLYESDDVNPLVVAEKLSSSEKKKLNNVAIRIGHVIYYVETDSLDKDDLKSLRKELKYKDDSFNDDVILVIENEKIKSFKEDIFDEDSLYDFLKSEKLSKFACEVTVSDEYENIGEISYEQYQCLYESDEAFALVLAQTTCSYCLQFKPVIDAYASENDLPIYVIEIDQLSSDDRDSLLSSLSYFDDNDNWGTPLTLGIKNKEVVSEISGYTDDESTIDSFFDELGIK